MIAPLLHNRTRAALEQITAEGSLSLIFYGPPSSGKRLSAGWVAQRLNCAVGGGDNCAICRRIELGSDPDFIVLGPEDKPSISVEQIRKLLGTLALAPYRSTGQRLVVIDNAQALTTEAQNALLKVLEEPPPATRFILLTGSLEALLPTVRSRLGLVFFAPVPSADLTPWLEQNYGTSAKEAKRLAELSGGLVGEAVTLATDPERAKQQAAVAEVASGLLSASRFDRLQIARSVIDAKTPPTLVVSVLHRQIVSRVVDGSPDSPRLAAVATARRLLSAGVAPRVVLERMSLEL